MAQLHTRPAYSREVFAWQSVLHSTTLVFNYYHALAFGGRAVL